MAGKTNAYASDSLKIESWYVVHSKPRQEKTASEQLQNQDFIVYLPMCKAYKKSRNKSITVIEPMFPRYLFVRPSRSTQSMSVIRSTVGVSKLVMFGQQPALLSDAAVDLIRQAEGVSLAAGIDQIMPFKPGMKVQMQDPVFANIEALVQSVSKDRVTILLEILGRPQSLQVDFADVVPL